MKCTSSDDDNTTQAYEGSFWDYLQSFRNHELKTWKRIYLFFSEAWFNLKEQKQNNNKKFWKSLTSHELEKDKWVKHKVKIEE